MKQKIQYIFYATNAVLMIVLSLFCYFERDKKVYPKNDIPFCQINVKAFSIEEGESYQISDFLSTTAKDCEVSYEKEEMKSYHEPGTYRIKLLAKGKNCQDNVYETTLLIKEKIPEQNNENEEARPEITNDFNEDINY